MRANNSFHLEGRLTKDPEFFPGNMPRVRVRLAVEGYDRSAKQKKADFFSVTIFGRTAEAVNQYCEKGSYLSVGGELRQNDYTDKQGVQHHEMQLVASDIAFGPRPGGDKKGDDFGFDNFGD